jgi:hypothetical protein
MRNFDSIPMCLSRAAGLLGVALVLAAAPAWSAEVAWGTTPSAPAGTLGEMFGVAAGGRDDVWAVGAFNPGESPTAVLTRPFAQHWDGHAWTATPVPLERLYASQSARLADTAIIGPNTAWAVGHVDDIGSLAARSLAYRWDGTQWQRVPTPDVAPPRRPDRLEAVASRTADDAWSVGATGYPAHALALHWDGAAWTRQDVPDIGGLVDVLAPAGDLWMASDLRVMHRPDGAGWSVLPPLPIEGQPGALALHGIALAGGRLWAVGTVAREFGETVVFAPYAAAWRDGRWKEVVVDEAGAILTGVATARDGAVLASAFDGSVVRLQIDGDTHQVTPLLGAQTLDAIAADPDGRPWAVGAVYEGSGFSPLLVNAPGIGQGGIRVTTDYGGAAITWIGPVNGSGMADPSGFFDVGGLPAGSYQVIASGTGCSPGVAQVQVRSGRVERVAARVEC